MKTFPSQSLLRAALLPETRPSSAVVAAIGEEVRATPQRRPGRDWPWHIGPAAIESDRARTALFRVAFAALVALAALAALVVGARFLGRPVLSAPITFVRQGELLAVDPVTKLTSPVAAFARFNVISLTTSASGRLLMTYHGTPTSLQRDPLVAQVFDADGRPGAILALPSGTILVRDGLTWAPDGASILADVSVAGIHRLAIFDSVSGAARLIGPDRVPADQGSWSPDGHSIAFRAPLPDSNAPAIWVLDVASNEARPMTGTLQGPVATYSSPTWSPDGRMITFEGDSTNSGFPVGIWSIDLVDRTVRRLTPDGVPGYFATWSPDGRWIGFADFVNLGSATCATVLSVMHPDGSGLRELVPNGWPGGWTPGGQLVFEVASKLDGPGMSAAGLPGAPFGGIGLIDPDGTDLSVLVAYLASDAATDPSPGCGWSYSPTWQHVP